jgi:solute carrier family 29 (equilibrative nucleoside transporter), member 1/2/3
MPPGLFFAFVISNGLVQAAAGSYLQASVVAVASLFGPLAMQAVMTGQAVVAVLISGIQLLSASASVHSSSTVINDGSAEERSAFAFFGLSTLFLLATVAAHAWLVRLPVYKTVVVPFEQHSKLLVDATHRRERSRSFSGEQLELQSSRFSRIFKVNATYNFAVAYVFVVTLVR